MSRLVGVGVGPGDPDLVTVRAVRVLREADVVLVPVMDAAVSGRAEETVRHHAGHHRVRRLVFDLSERRGTTPAREAAWEAAGSAVAEAFDGGASTVAFATIGDPNVYSTFSYLAATVRELRPGVVVETVPGITAMQDLASRAGVPLVEGQEVLALVPLTAGVERLRALLATADTVVAYKGGRHLPEVVAALADAGRLEGAVLGASLGLDGEVVRPLADPAVEREVPYLSTVLAAPAARPRGGRL